jgi:uncharacterized protein DUF4236
MGFYIRKSISVGPFRFNLSQSGIGVSTGIKGFRVGAGPRGNYIHMGRGGLYFRATLPSSTTGTVPVPVEPVATDLVTEDDRFRRLETGTASNMVDSTSGELLQEINGKAKRVSLWPIALTLCGLAHIMFVPGGAPLWLLWLTIPLAASFIAAAAYRDNIKKTVVLFYSMEPHLEEAYQALHNVFDTARCCGASWQIPSERHTVGLYDWKKNSGVDSVVTRSNIRFGKDHPRYLKTNIVVPFIPAQRLQIYFFPDRILVYDGSSVGAINYSELAISTRNIRFHEEDGVPSDAQIVGSTWRYVNKSGGPDRRFSDNAQIPIVLYEQVQFTSPSGLGEAFQFSRQGIGADLKKAVSGMANAIAGKVDDQYVVCPCNVCNGHIEFPESGAGQTVTCPFCKMDTVLFIPARKL